MPLPFQKDEAGWNEFFEALVRYRDRNGGSLSVRVNENWEDYGGKNLYPWVSRQRRLYRNGLEGLTPYLSKERQAKLESIGLDLTSPAGHHDDSWNENLAALLRYRDRNGGNLSVRVNENWDEYGGKNLYSWVARQRLLYRNMMNGTQPALSKERLEKLQSIGFDFTGTKVPKPVNPPSNRAPRPGQVPAPSPKSNTTEAWNANFTALLQYRDKNGGSISVSNKSTNWDEYGGKNLYNWVSHQRHLYLNGLHGKKPCLSKECIEKLESIGFDFNTSGKKFPDAKDSWNEYFAALLEYRDKNQGSLTIPSSKENWEEYGGLNLYTWTVNQRAYYRNGALSKDCIEKLELIGFHFNPARGRKPKQPTDPAFTWDGNYRMLVEMRQQHGQTLEQIEATHDRLNRWMGEQRMLYHNRQMRVVPMIQPERIEKLRQIGFNFGLRRQDDCTSQQQRVSHGTGGVVASNISLEQELIQKLDHEIQEAENYQQWLQANSCVEQVSNNVNDVVSWKTLGESSHENVRLGPPSNKSGLLEDSVEGLEFVRAVKLLPKYFKGSSEHFFTLQELEQQLLPKFRSKNSSLNFIRFSASLREAKHDQNSIELVVHGVASTADLFLAHTKRFLTAKTTSHNYQLLLSEGNHVDVELDANEKLGAELYAASYINSQGVLLRVRDSDSSGQLARKLDVHSVSCGAAVVKLGGSPCKTIKDFLAVLDQHKSTGKAVILELCVSKDSSLTGFHLSSLSGVRSNSSSEKQASVTQPSQDCFSSKESNAQLSCPRHKLSMRVTGELDNTGATVAANPETTHQGEAVVVSKPAGSQLLHLNAVADHPDTNALRISNKRKHPDRRIRNPSNDRQAGFHIPKKARMGHRGEEESLLKEYLIDFDSCQPLGFYCENAMQGNQGGSVCKITSVCPNGQARNDLRIQAGTVVVSAALAGNDEKHAIQSSSQLKTLYERARETKIHIILSFINSHVLASSVVGSCAYSRDWHGNEWRGKAQSGWAGGSICNQFKFVDKRPPHQGRNTAPIAVANQEESASSVGWVSRVSDASKNTASIAVTSQEESPSSDGWVLRVSDISANSHSYKLKSILQTSSKVKGPSKRVQVHSDPVAETRLFYKGKPTNHFLVQSTDSSAKSLLHPSESFLPRVSKEDALHDAIYQDSCRDVLFLLDNQGAAADISMSSQVLDELRKYVKKQVHLHKEEVKTLTSPSLSLEAKLRDLEMKDKLLKIYMTAKATLQMSKALKNWISFDISAVSIVNLHLGAGSALDSSSCLLRVQTMALSKVEEKLKELPRKTFSERIEYDTVHPYRMKYNPSFSDWVLELKLMGVSADGLQMEELGTASVHLSELYGKCSKDGSWWEGAFEIVPAPGEHLQTGTFFKIRAKRQCPYDSIEEKRRAERKRIRNIEEWVLRFNEDLKKEEAVQPLSANIRVGGGSLLHAAVYLEDVDRVQKLIELGADPLAKSSSMGSAVQLAMNMADGQVDREERRSHLQTIAKVLQQACKTELKDAAPINKENRTPSEGSSSSTNASFHGSNAAHNVELPTIDPLWIIPQSHRPFLCRHQTGCKFYPECVYIHIQKLWGEKLREMWETCNQRQLPMDRASFERLSQTKMAKDSSGNAWFTAALSTAKGQRSRNQIAIFAEGGKTSAKAHNGVTWYPTKEDALEALEIVVIVSHWSLGRGNAEASSRRHAPPLYMNRSGHPQQNAPFLPPPGSRKRNYPS